MQCVLHHQLAPAELTTGLIFNDIGYISNHEFRNKKKEGRILLTHSECTFPLLLLLSAINIVKTVTFVKVDKKNEG